MINVKSNVVFEARVSAFPANIVVECSLRDNRGGTVGPLSQISQDPPGSGSYVTTFKAPEYGGQYTVVWQWGDKNPSRTAVEDVIVDGPAEPPPPTHDATVGPLIQHVGITQPHFDLPFRYGRGREVVVQQDTVEDIRNCVEAGVRTLRGTRPWVPKRSHL
jgi:hypothetical protein